MGGCTDSGTSYEPLKNASTGGDLTAVQSCYYLKLPNATLDIVPMLTRPLNVARAYAQAETYGDIHLRLLRAHPDRDRLL